METTEKIRKSYMKPRVTQVKLEIQEATLTACKKTGSTIRSACSSNGCKVIKGS